MIFTTPERRKFCFHICWFVRLYVSNITENHMNRYLWNFQDRSDMVKTTTWNNLRLITWILEYFSYFYSSSVGNLTKNGWTKFHEIFGIVEMIKTRNSLKHFGGVMFNPLDPGSIFLAVCLLATLRKTGTLVVMQFSRYVGHDTHTHKIIGKTVSWLDCFIVLQLGNYAKMDDWIFIKFSK